MMQCNDIMRSRNVVLCKNDITIYDGGSYLIWYGGYEAVIFIILAELHKHWLPIEC